MKELTIKQKNVLHYVEVYLQNHGYPPTIREVGENFTITPKGAYDHLIALEKKNYIKCNKNRRRAIEILKSENGLPISRENMIHIPLVGQVAAGVPLVAEENIEEYITFPRSLVQGEELFALRVSGDSMKDAGIFDGDIAILKKQSIAQEGDIVVALIEDEATLKYFYRESEDTVRLEPANTAYKPIYTQNVLVLGKLTGMYRSVE